MYIDSIAIQNFRTFDDVKIEFLHSGRTPQGLPQPEHPNLNLLLGDNGSGKTTLLKAISLAALGPAVQDARLPAYRLVRRRPDGLKTQTSAEIAATFVTHEQDRTVGPANSAISITRKRDLEMIRWKGPGADAETVWDSVFSSSSDAFFVVGYGANRRVERSKINPAARDQAEFVRARRIMGLFDETHSLTPLVAWLPQYKTVNPGRHKQVVTLINRLLIDTGYTFCDELDGEELVFEKDGLRVPLGAMSDGYRAFMAWVGDLLYHIVETAPSGARLVENQGIVLIDEIDLHLHPRWQLTVLPTLARALPNLQFVVTSHSPLVAGSLQWMNILVLKSAAGASEVTRLRESVHGMDADQILLTDLFGLETTRAGNKAESLKKLTSRASQGDAQAALALLRELGHGEPVL